MEQIPAVFVVMDISGYTEFVRMHGTSIIHAEQVITELMESMLDRSESPLVLDKLQGDAAFFYARDTGDPQMGEQISAMVLTFFNAFTELEAKLVSCTWCVCGACNDIDKLRLKAIVHKGEVLLKQMGGTTQLAGPDVILTYRLLKNHVEGEHYILFSKAFHDTAGDIGGLEAHWATETYDINTLDVAVYYPDPDEVPVPKPTIMDRLRLFFRLESYLVRRLFGAKPPGVFRNLPGSTAPDVPQLPE